MDFMREILYQSYSSLVSELLNSTMILCSTLTLCMAYIQEINKINTLPPFMNLSPPEKMPWIHSNNEWPGRRRNPDKGS